MTLIKETIFHPPQLRRLRPILITISAHNNGGKSKRKGKRDEPQLLELTRTEPFLSCSVRWSGRRSTLRAWHYILSSTRFYNDAGTFVLLNNVNQHVHYMHAALFTQANLVLRPTVLETVVLIVSPGMDVVAGFCHT